MVRVTHGGVMVSLYSNISNVICRSVYSFACPNVMKNIDSPQKKITFMLPDLTPPRVLKLKNPFFIRISITLSTNASTKILNFGLKLFYACFLPKLEKMKIWIFEHHENTKTKFKILVLAFVEGIMLSRIKTKLSSLTSFKTIEEDFLKLNSRRCLEIILKLKKNHRK